MMIADYIRKNFYWCIFWGFVLQCIAGTVIAMSHYLFVIVLGWSIYVVGTASLLIGFGFYIVSKGRSPAWSLLALISIIGWGILIILRDKSVVSLDRENHRGTGHV
ncbi:MAG: hypothetical protein A2Z25_18190 [Planctomycetes bacterium RBG_16_55_9]|nr:MAG: hypothetical protein A2Z25_18190 [Planctomycetes bacterium RBG_16_55_9]